MLEEDVDYFIVECSKDGNIFIEIECLSVSNIIIGVVYIISDK